MEASIISSFISRSVLAIPSVHVSKPTPRGFEVDVTLALSKCGTFAASVDFAQGFELWCDEVPEDPLEVSTASSNAEGSPSKKAKDKDKGKAKAQEEHVATAPAGAVTGRVECSDGKGTGTLHAHLTLAGGANGVGVRWVEHVLRSGDAIKMRISAKVSVKIRAVHRRADSVVLTKAFELHGLAGLSGAISPASSSLSLSNSQAAPLKSSKAGVCLISDLAISNPSPQIGLQLGQLVCALEKRSAPGKAVGSAVIEAFNLPPGEKVSLKVVSTFEYGGLADVAVKTLFGLLVQDKTLQGLELIVRGERVLPSSPTEEGAVPAEKEAPWLKVLLDRTPLFINLPDNLKIVQGVTFSCLWSPTSDQPTAPAIVA